MAITITVFEAWKPVVGYEGRYEVSNLGRVRSLGVKYWHKPNQGWKQKKGRVLKPAIHHGGYPVVCLHNGAKQKMHRVHTLVLTAFRGPAPEGQEARHLDGNPANPRLSNLRWATHAENMRDMAFHGRGNTKLTWEHVKAIREATTPAKELGAQYGVRPSTIYRIRQHRTWKEAA